MAAPVTVAQAVGCAGGGDDIGESLPGSRARLWTCELVDAEANAGHEWASGRLRRRRRLERPRRRSAAGRAHERNPASGCQAARFWSTIGRAELAWPIAASRLLTDGSGEARLGSRDRLSQGAAYRTYQPLKRRRTLVVERRNVKYAHVPTTVSGNERSRQRQGRGSNSWTTHAAAVVGGGPRRGLNGHMYVDQAPGRRDPHHGGACGTLKPLIGEVILRRGR